MQVYACPPNPNESSSSLFNNQMSFVLPQTEKEPLATNKLQIGEQAQILLEQLGTD